MTYGAAGERPAGHRHVHLAESRRFALRRPSPSGRRGAACSGSSTPAFGSSRARAGEGFTVQNVVERSGLSLRSFYNHFAGKHELLLALFEESIRMTADPPHASEWSSSDDTARSPQAPTSPSTTGSARARSEEVTDTRVCLLERSPSSRTSSSSDQPTRKPPRRSRRWWGFTATPLDDVAGSGARSGHGPRPPANGRPAAADHHVPHVRSRGSSGGPNPDDPTEGGELLWRQAAARSRRTGLMGSEWTPTWQPRARGRAGDRDGWERSDDLVRAARGSLPTVWPRRSGIAASVPAATSPS